jgi:hypothetical protein
MVLESRLAAMILFAGCILFFNWPFVSITDRGLGIVIYLFFFWAIAIAGLQFYCRRENKREYGDEDI